MSVPFLRRAEPRTLLRLANGALLALVALELLWELWLAPLRPGGSWLALKAVPLALLGPGLIRGSARARNLAALLSLVYFSEGIVRAVSESGRSAWIAAVAAALAVVAFVALFLTDRAERRRLAA
ncbi:MAG: DUF2069 domain-containing protein [Casimicrobiaceae bacterium]